MKLFVPRERHVGETRVAIVPETVKKLAAKTGLEIQIERGAGAGAHFTDAAYRAAGATIGDAAWANADVVCVVRAPSGEQRAALKPAALLVGLLDPYSDLDLVRSMVEQEVTAVAMELIPRTTLAQKMDALSSQASIAGYKAVLLAASRLGKYFPLLMTAAGTVKPARVVIMGAGVAGLQAIATAKRLGAVVEVSDIRAEVEEQVKSLGGRFIELPDLQSGKDSGGYAREVTKEFLARQQQIVAEHVKLANVVITTALVPGRPAPKLVTAEMVASMKPGSVIVDLAVSAGGNCALSQAGQEVVEHEVLIIGHPNLPATMPEDASMLYARNVQELLLHMHDDDNGFGPDLEDEIVGGCVVTHDGRIHHPRVRQAVEGGDA